jgi:two-component system chemotaxis response regulator CheY
LLTITLDTHGCCVSNAGYQVSTASRGDEGVERYYSNPTDAVLLDLTLPDARGTDILAVLRSINPSLRCAIVHGGSGDVTDSLLAAGASEVLLKPFIPGQVVETVRKLTGPASSEPTTV